MAAPSIPMSVLLPKAHKKKGNTFTLVHCLLVEPLYGTISIPNQHYTEDAGGVFKEHLLITSFSPQVTRAAGI